MITSHAYLFNTDGDGMTNGATENKITKWKLKRTAIVAKQRSKYDVKGEMFKSTVWQF